MTREEALGIVRKYNYVPEERTALETLIPELAKSEDERIRKALVEVLHRLPTSAFESGAEGGYLGATKEEMLSYLEKHKESLHISETCKENPDSFTDEDERIREEIISALKFANDGGVYDKHIAYLEKQKEQEPINESNMHEPTLDEAMKWNEAYEKGYSLGYKNGRNEQKPAEWSEKYIADIFEKVGLAKIVREQGNDELTNALQDAMLELSKVENPEWSEEDEEISNNILNLICSQITYVTGQGTMSGKQYPTYTKERDWFMNRLKSLRPQCHQTDEDKNISEEILEYFNKKKDFRSRWYVWVKYASLNPHWTPEEEQMDALLNTLHPDDPYYYELKSLYDDLKKLM